MSVTDVILLVVSSVCFCYLVYALVRPERF